MAFSLRTIGRILIKSVLFESRQRIEISICPTSGLRPRRVKWAVERLDFPFFRVHYRLSDINQHYGATGPSQNSGHVISERQPSHQRKSRRGDGGSATASQGMNLSSIGNQRSRLDGKRKSPRRRGGGRLAKTRSRDADHGYHGSPWDLDCNKRPCQPRVQLACSRQPTRVTSR